jgi:DNA (cytosine-5)-methyltransferase 1
MYRQVDLCSGTGAFNLGLDEYCEVVYSNDIEKKSKLIYELNFKNHFVLQDLNTIEANSIPDHEVLTCGFPCQPFSIAGKRLGFFDDRSDIFWKILEIVSLKRPKIIILENVKNILTHDKGKTIEKIEKSFTDLGYNFQKVLLDTCKHTSIPHHRERLYMIITIYKLKQITLEEIEQEKLTNFFDKLVDEKFYYTDKSFIYSKLKESVKNRDTVYQYRRTSVRENKNNRCPTLTANMGVGGHNVPIILNSSGIRKLTPKECFKLQGFPDSYKFPDIANCHLYKLAGNAVTVELVKRLSKKIFSEIGDI